MVNKEHAIKAADIIDGKKGKDIVILDVSENSSFTDFFVIAHGTSERQLKTLAEEVEKGLEENNFPLYHKEGKETSGWILLDFGDMIVHLFLEEQRQRYNIEKLWDDCNAIPYQDTIE
ncbi:MAG: ribosome silencing factor [Clostridia bacterium]|nr:ribosome silencing factor [Clostridia bacterium]